MSLGTTIEHLPPEALSCLFQRLVAAEIHRLAFASGSKLLATKTMQHGGLTSIRDRFRRHSDKKVSLTTLIFASPHLLSLELHFPNQYINGLNAQAINRFPSTIEELTLNCSNALSCWLDIPDANWDTRESLWASVSETKWPQLVNTQKVFPNLRRLSLKSSKWNPYEYIEGSWAPQTRADFLLNLPRTLEHLEFQPLESFERSMGSLLPPNLTSFATRFEWNRTLNWIPPSLHSSLRHLDICFAHSDNFIEIPQFPTELTSLRCGSVIPALYFFVLPKSLTKLELHSILNHGSSQVEGKLELSSSDAALLKVSPRPPLFAGLPAGLKYLSVSSKTEFSAVLDAHALPRGLEYLSLEMGSKVSDFSIFPPAIKTLRLITRAWATSPPVKLETIPPTVTEFVLDQSSKIRDSDLKKIPSSVTALGLLGCGFSLTDAMFQNLPPRITKLLVSNNKITMAAIVESLPPTLHTLYIPTHVEFADTDILMLPKQLNRFSVGKIIFHGGSLPRDLQELNSHSLQRTICSYFSPPLCHTLTMGHPNGEPDPFYYSSTELVLHNPTKYPNSIRKLIWAGPKPPLNQVLWMTPNITELICNSGVRLDTDRLPNFLTKLHIEGPQSPSLVANLTDTLTWLSLPDTSLSSDSTVFMPPLLTELKIGFVFPSFLAKCTNLLSLWMTRARPLSDAHVRLFPRSITTLKIQDITDDGYGYYAYQTTQKMSLSGAHVPHLPPSLTEYQNEVFQLRGSDVSLLPPSLTSLSVSSYLTNNLMQAMDTITENTTTLDEVAEIIGRSFLSSVWPQLKISVPSNASSRYRYPIESPWAFEVSPNFYTKIPKHITTLIINTLWNGGTMPHGMPGIALEQLSQLPQGLTTLDMSCENALPHNATFHLPRTLTDLRMNGNNFSAGSIADLPRGLVSLALSPVRKWTPKCCVALPPNLTRFRLNCAAAYNGSLEAIPKSVTILSLDSPALTNAYLPFLPPRLIFFECTSKNFTKDALKTTLPHTIRMLTVPGIASIFTLRGHNAASNGEFIMEEDTAPDYDYYDEDPASDTDDED